MKCSTKQMDSHGVDRSRYPFASFCHGRGWRGHKTLTAARKAARYDAAVGACRTSGSIPQHMVARTDTGETI